MRRLSGYQVRGGFRAVLVVVQKQHILVVLVQGRGYGGAVALAYVVGTLVQEHGLVLGINVASLGQHLACLVYDILFNNLCLISLVVRVIVRGDSRALFPR